jgi:hypothetical protein
VPREATHEGIARRRCCQDFQKHQKIEKSRIPLIIFFVGPFKRDLAKRGKTVEEPEIMNR